MNFIRKNTERKTGRVLDGEKRKYFSILSIAFSLQTIFTVLVLSVVLLFSANLSKLHAKEKVMNFKSSEKAVLVELFTSEGCSSCPPADEWMSKLLDHPSLWDEVVPVAWHVNYWDYIGWKDKFASQKYTDRQRRFKALGLSSGVYTPGLYAQGREWRSWFGRRNIDSQRREVLKKFGSAEYTFDVSVEDENKVKLLLSTRAKSDLVAEMVVLGFGIKTDVKRGENHGKTLVHDFVVLHSSDAILAKNKTSIDMRLPGAAALDNKASRYGVAIWLREKNSLIPLAVAGSWLGSL